ncbi:glycosyltransferase family 2 protein [Butyrivibrio sp. YAB3001]|uniref:glycosyltransferase family 2 protein n=1 Tax=Butyrivibrio sp. YAB3001 TaxID=1520812 RepID=UPI0008F61CD6|nr:glycosyltransferase family 2 protein [Butyrivibrio sp. YAB3001]SFC77186.1 Glycosyl transferase family 2 [Butyrivibrio sp. YAB3001]
MDHLLISVIIPVYQAESTLERCVHSCLNQKNIDPKEFEIILIDDGSTDGSSELCDKLSVEDELHRIKVKHISNHGVSFARNVGINEALGRFVVFVDSDDHVSENYLSKLVKHSDESTVLVDENRSYVSSQKISGFNYIENSVLNENTHVWGKLFDRVTLKEGRIKFQEKLTIGEDLLFLIDFGIYVGKKRGIRCISSGDYYYSDNDNGAMNSAFKESYLDQLKCWRSAEKKLLSVRKNLSTYSMVSVSVSQILTALLVIGKVAVQKGDRNKELDELAIKKSREQIEHALKRRGVFAALSTGHKIKVLLLKINPDAYVRLYAKHKGV